MCASCHNFLYCISNDFHSKVVFKYPDVVKLMESTLGNYSVLTYKLIYFDHLTIFLFFQKCTRKLRFPGETNQLILGRILNCTTTLGPIGGIWSSIKKMEWIKSKTIQLTLRLCSIWYNSAVFFMAKKEKYYVFNGVNSKYLVLHTSSDKLDL